MASIVEFVDALDGLLKDATNGVNAQLETLSVSPALAAVYSTWNEADRQSESPSLTALHVDVQPDTASSQKRDWTHRVMFTLYYADYDQSVQRKYAARVVQALMRTLDPATEDLNSRYSGATITNIAIGGASVLFPRFADHRDELIIAQVDFMAREEL